MALSLTAPDLIGYAGVATILAAYALVQFERLSPSGALYPILNGGGALAVLVSLYHSPNWPSIVIEIAWLLISAAGLIRWMMRRGAR